MKQKKSKFQSKIGSVSITDFHLFVWPQAATLLSEARPFSRTRKLGGSNSDRPKTAVPIRAEAGPNPPRSLCGECGPVPLRKSSVLQEEDLHCVSEEANNQSPWSNSILR